MQYKIYSILFSSYYHINMRGIHYLIDYDNLTFEFLNNLEIIKKIMDEVIKVSGTEILHKKFHKFKPQGLTGIYLLSESHLSFHTWPEKGTFSIDLFSCGNNKLTKKAIRFILDNMKGYNYKLKKIPR